MAKSRETALYYDPEGGERAQQVKTVLVCMGARRSCALPSTMPIAPSWQADAHRPQPLHFSLSISMIFRTMLYSSIYQMCVFCLTL